MDFIGSINDILWGPWTPWVLLFAGVLFTIWSKFTQYVAMTHGIQVVRRAGWWRMYGRKNRRQVAQTPGCSGTREQVFQ